MKTDSCVFWKPGLRASVGLSFLVTACLLSTVACGGGSNAASENAALNSQVTVTANPLVAQYSLTTSKPATVQIQFGPTSSYGLTTSPQATSSSGNVTILVAGMQQQMQYYMRAIINYADGTQQYDGGHTFSTGTIPAVRLPQIFVTTPSGPGPTPGVELMSLTPTGSNQLMCLATDTKGNIIWYYDYAAALGIPQPIKLLPNGHMLMVLGEVGPPNGIVREIDLAGNIIRQFSYTDVANKLQAAGYNIQVVSIDHDILAMPNGHLVMILTDSRVFTDLPGYPGQTTVLGNAIVDLDTNNNPAWVWDAFDHLDINRHPMFFPDWTHTNSLAYSPDDGNLLISVRHQSWVLKLDYQNGTGSGDILWKLGDQGDFVFNSGQPDWFYAQHDANIVSANSTGDFELALFDNGDYRQGDTGSFIDNATNCAPGNPPLCYSAPAIFDVNEATMTASRKWSYGMVYSWWGGVTQELPNSNILVDETAPVDLAPAGSRIQEVTQTASPTVVWQMIVTGQASYRTIHLPSLYPGVQW